MATPKILSSRRALDAALATVAVGVVVLIALPQVADVTAPGVVPLSRQFERQHDAALETMRRVVTYDEAWSWFVVEGELVSHWSRREQGEPYAEFVRRHADLLDVRGGWATTVERELWTDLMESLETAATDPTLRRPDSEATIAPTLVRMRISRGGLHVIPGREPFEGPVPWATRQDANELVLDEVFPHGP